MAQHFLALKSCARVQVCALEHDDKTLYSKGGTQAPFSYYPLSLVGLRFLPFSTSKLIIPSPITINLYLPSYLASIHHQIILPTSKSHQPPSPSLSTTTIDGAWSLKKEIPRNPLLPPPFFLQGFSLGSLSWLRSFVDEIPLSKLSLWVDIASIVTLIAISIKFLEIMFDLIWWLQRKREFLE